LNFYSRNDFVKPQQWCEKIAETSDLCCELYYLAAQYFAMVAEYDLADQIINTALEKCNDNTYDKYLKYSRETEISSLIKLQADNLKYRTKKPYWPQTEERRRAIAQIYDEKGIKYPRKKPVKIAESDFEPIQEYFGEAPVDYCAFWCAAAFSVAKAKSIYQIAAVKVRNGKIMERFQSYVRPISKDGESVKKSAAKEAEIDISVLNEADEVDQVMGKFLAFAGNDILVSTGALGEQKSLISRAARYSGMKKLNNQFWDLLDYAADVSEEFDLKNNTREYLINHYRLKEGTDALGKAEVNILIYDKLHEDDNL
jgi:hypothetical protein